MNKKYNKPCYDHFYENPKISSCLEGSGHEEECTHLNKGLTWGICSSGGMSGYDHKLLKSNWTFERIETVNPENKK